LDAVRRQLDQLFSPAAVAVVDIAAALAVAVAVVYIVDSNLCLLICYSWQ